MCTFLYLNWKLGKLIDLKVATVRSSTMHYCIRIKLSKATSATWVLLFSPWLAGELDWSGRGAGVVSEHSVRTTVFKLNRSVPDLSQAHSMQTHVPESTQLPCSCFYIVSHEHTFVCDRSCGQYVVVSLLWLVLIFCASGAWPAVGTASTLTDLSCERAPRANTNAGEFNKPWIIVEHWS